MGPAEYGPVAVIGAGITGLTAAVELEAAGISCILLEKDSIPGGLCRTMTMDGIVFDRGPHMLMMNPHRSAGRFLIDLLAGERLIRRRYLFAIQNSQRYWSMPVTPIELLQYPPYAAESVCKALLSRAFSRDQEHDLRGYLTARAGKAVHEQVFEPLIRKKLGVRGDRLHSHWWTRPPREVQGVHRPALPPSDRSRLRTVTGKIIHDSLPHYFYPEEGIGKVVSLLRERFSGELVRNCGEISIVQNGHRIESLCFKRQSMPVSAVVWTAPVGEYYRSTGGSAPAETPASATKLVYITVKTDERRKRPFLYTYHHGVGTVFNRVYYPASIFRDRTPRGVEGFCFEIRSDQGAAAAESSQLAEMTHDQAKKAGILQGVMLAARTEEIRRASPLFPLDYMEREPELFSAAYSMRNLVFAGRQGCYTNCLIPGAVEHGLMAADAVKTRMLQSI